MTTRTIDDVLKSLDFSEGHHEREADILRRRESVRKNYAKVSARAGLPPVYQGADMNTLTIDDGNRAAVESATRYLDNPRRFLFVHGGAGRGKTWIAAAIFRELLLRGAIVQFIRAVDLVGKIKSAIEKNTSHDVLHDFRTRPILIIDDLGAERATEYTVPLIYDLIDYRYIYHFGTIITSNSSGKDIAETFGTRIMSRIHQAGDVVEVKGKDRRLKR